MSFSEGGHGHFIGEVTIADEKYYSEALLTVDGAVRIYVGGLADEVLHTGAPPPEEVFHPQESTLFVGTIDDIAQSSASGSGAVIGQICDGASARFCDEPARAQVLLASSSREHLRFLTGDLTVTTATEVEHWTVELTSHSAYYASGAGRLGGVFKERLAPFAQAEEMHIEIEPDGRVRFASAASGCTGDGTVLPHLGGEYDVHDVHLQITGCDAQFEYLNSEFEGLATETQGGYWDYDTWLVVFLSAPDGPPPRPAVTMRAEGGVD
jgi:hypothetical protein